MPDRLSHSEMAFGLDRLVHAKADWLSRFSQGKLKRPDHDIETRRGELAILKQAASDYHSASERAPHLTKERA